ncbi:hypothetical protein HX783_15280 [Pseudomonas sp. D2002]|nr:hypothetical protein [Pseudomonas sp. D2002]
MPEQPVTSPPEGSFNVDLRGVHYDFLKDRVPAWFSQGSTQRQEELANHEMELPSWYLTATAQQKADLADSHTRYRETLNQVENSLGNIQDVLAFAEQPLKDAIKQRFNLELDVRNVYFARKYGFKSRDDLFGVLVFDQAPDPSLSYEYRGVSLLEAALANFTPDEERASLCNDCQVITTWNSYDGEVIATPHAVNSQALAIPAHEFAQMCRTLDLGNLYQQHLQAIVQPEDETQRSALEQQLQEHQRQLLALSAEVASHQAEWGIGADAYRMIKQVITDPATATLDGKPVTFAALKVFGCVLVGPLLIGPVRKDSDSAERLLVFIPNDPQQPLKEYADSGAFMADLRTRLHSASYRRFFSRFIPQREQGLFFQQFNRLYKPTNGNGAAGDYPLAPKPSKLPLDELRINGNLWEQLRKAQVSKIFSDARAVAVPTGDEDRKARMDRLASYADAVNSAFNLLAFVVPGLGPIMLVVGAAQMCSEFYEGIEVANQGDLRAMWAHFSSVALNVAMLVTGAKVLPEVKLSSRVDNLRPVTMPSGKQLLWNPDLTPYKVPVELPADAKPDALGLYQHNGQAVLPHEGDYYRVRQEPETGQYRIQHPSRPGAYEPQLEHNHAGAWSHEVEEPLTWDSPTLIRRLGLDQRGLDTQTLEQARMASGVEEDALRQTFVEHEPVPLLLEDSIQHFKAHQALTTFVEHMHSSDPAVYSQADPVLQLNMLQRRGMLPADTPLRVMRGDGRLLWENDAPVTASRRVVVVSDSQMARGELLKEVLNTLQGVDPTLKEIPGSADDSLEVRAGKLRQYLGDTVETFKGPLAEERYKASTLSADPDVQMVLLSYPKLPTAAAEHLLKRLNNEQLQALRRTGMLPKQQAEQAKWCEQETRVSRAYEGLHLDTLADVDSQRLALRTLETLPGWPSGTRVELRQYSATGPLLDAVGPPDAPASRTLVVMNNGQFQAPTPRDFYSATWDLLSATERQGLGFTDASQMKAAIQQAPLPRASLRTVLLEHPLLKPNVDPTVRLLGGGGGVRQWARGTFSSAQVRARKLYPMLGEREITVIIERLGDDVSGGLSRLEAEYRGLKKALKVWERAQPREFSAYDPNADAPAINVKNILSCWRREGGAHELSLALTDLPALNADFSHVESLELFKIKWPNNADTFFQNFPRLKRLSISTSIGLTSLPDVIGGMNNLTELSLGFNDIRLTSQSAAKLSALSNLETLMLNNNPLGMSPDFSAMSRLKKVSLSSTGIDQWPVGLRADTGLDYVNLEGNGLSEVPAINLDPPPDQLEAIARINRVTLLDRNKFPADYWQKFDSYWLRLSRERPDLLEGTLPGAFDVGGPRIEQYQSVYPARTRQQAREFLRNLGAGADAELQRLEDELFALSVRLSDWVYEQGDLPPQLGGGFRRRPLPPNMADRSTAKDRIIECWRRETEPVLASDDMGPGYTLDLSHLNLPSLPDLGVDFSHAVSLKLRFMNLGTSPEGFLSRFPNVRHLDMAFNELREVPLALGNMNALTSLYLNSNRISLTQQTSAILSGRTALQALRLGNNPLGMIPTFSAMTDLRVLSLHNTGIDAWPNGLLELQALEDVDLRSNEITTIPDAIIAPTDELLATAKRINDLTNASSNPLLPATQQKVRDYAERLHREGLETTNTSNVFAVRALNVRRVEVIDAGPHDAFLRWAEGMPTDEVASKRAQWFALRGEQKADGFFNQLERLETTAASHADQQRRIWELIDAISPNTPESERLRAEVFELGGEAKCCDRAVFTFSNMELAVMVSKARVTAGDLTQGPQLRTLARGLFRLDALDRIASADIARSQAIVNDPAVTLADKLPHTLRLSEEVEIRLAYRVGLKDRLQLPGQPQKMQFADLAHVTPAMLEAAYNEVVALDHSPKEFHALLAREFWQDYLANKYHAQFEAQRQPYHAQMADLTRRFEAQTLAEALYRQQADDLQAQWAIKNAALLNTLTRQEIAQALLPRGTLEVLENPVSGLQLAQAQAIEFGGKPYFIASMPDAGDGEHYVLWVQAPDNPFALVSSAIIAKPDVAGVWKRRGSTGGIRPGVSQEVFEDASESMPMQPYTADELIAMRRQTHFTQLRNTPGSYSRVNNARYPLRDLQGKPIRIRTLQRKVRSASGVEYTSEQIKPYIKFEGYEDVGALYEAKLQRRLFTAQDMKAPGEKSLIGQSMVVANRRIAKGEIVGVYGGTVLPSQVASPGGQTYILLAGSRPASGRLGREPIEISGDNIISRINTNFDYDANGKPVRQAAGGYNVEGVGFDIEADEVWGAKTTRTDFILTAVFATEDIPAGAELRMNYDYSEGMIETQFA